MSHKFNFSDHINNNKNFLIKLGHSLKSKKKTKLLLNKADSSQIFCIIEICFNILRARFPLTSVQKNKLKKKADLIRKVSRLRSEKSARKVIQTGHGIPVAAALVASFLLPILGDFISKKIIG